MTITPLTQRPTLPAALAFLLLLLGVAACSGQDLAADGDVEEEDAAEEAEDETPPVPVEVERVSRGDVFAVYTGTASLESDEDARVVAKVGGEVVQILVEESQAVRAGQVLARLDGDRLRLETERSRAEVRKLQQEYDRNLALHDRGLVSAGTFEGMKHELDALKASLEMAELELSYTEIRAPIDGVIAERYIKVGNTISANDPVFHITDNDPLLAYLHVPERDFRKLAVGQQADVNVDAIPGRAFRANIERISPVVDPETGTFKVTLEVSDETQRLLPGMFGRFRIVYDSRPDALLVPRVALVDDESERAVFIVEDGVAKRLAVQTGYPSGEHIEVVEGLGEDASVIVIGQAGLKDGSTVEVIERGGPTG